MRSAVTAGIICAVIPRVTYMGSEARSSAFAAAIVAWLTVILVVLLQQQNPSRRWWITYGVLLTLGVYVFLYTALIVVAHLLIVLSVRPPRGLIIRWVRTAAAAITVALPVVVVSVLQRGQVAFLAHRQEITPHKLLVSLWFGQPLFAAAAWALLVLALLARVTARGMPAHAEWSRQTRTPQLDVVAASWLLTPALLLIGGSLLVPVYTARYLSYCAPASALLIALGLDWTARRQPRVIAVGLLFIALCAAPAWLAQRQPNAKNNSDFAQTSAFIAAHAVPGDAVAFDESVRPSRWPRLALHLYPSAFLGLRDVTVHVPYPAGTSWHDSAYSLPRAEALGRFTGVHRLWLIEHSNGTTADTYGQAALAQLRYTAVHAFDTHRSVIYEYVNTGHDRP
jgi:mannosyltransferase